MNLLYIEDIISQLSNMRVNAYDRDIVESLNRQIKIDRKAYTEKQAKLAVKLCQRYIKSLNYILNLDIQPYLTTPMFKYPVRSNQITPRRVSVTPDHRFGKLIKIEFPYNDQFVATLRDYKYKNRSQSFIEWDSTQKAWLLDYSEINLNLIKSFITENDFTIDPEILDYYDSATRILDYISDFVPMLSLVDNKPIILNSNGLIPNIQSTNIFEAIFEARRFGVTIWDQTIDEYLDSDEVNQIDKTFLRNPPNDGFYLHSQTTSFDSLKNIVKYLTPIMFVIPNNSEFKKIKMSYSFLKEIGITNEEISVMFRLPNSTDKAFNDFIKDNHLNNPITDKTRAVFINDKITKPIVESKLHFNCVIRMGTRIPSNWMLNVYLKSCSNIICYSDHHQNRDSNFVQL